MTEYTVDQVVAAVEACAAKDWQDTERITRHVLDIQGRRECMADWKQDVQKVLMKAHRRGLVAHDVRHGRSGDYGRYGRRRAHWTTLAHKAKLDEVAARTPAEWAELAHADTLRRFEARVEVAGDAHWRMTVDAGWVQQGVRHAIDAGLVVALGDGKVIPVEGVERYEAAKARHEANQAAINARVEAACAAFDAAAGPHDHRHPEIRVGVDQAERLVEILAAAAELADETEALAHHIAHAGLGGGDTIGPLTDALLRYRKALP